MNISSTPKPAAPNAFESAGAPDSEWRASRIEARFEWSDADREDTPRTHQGPPR